jgi:hypothetical protein
MVTTRPSYTPEFRRQIVESMRAFGHIECGVHGTVVRGGEIAVGNVITPSQ